RISFLKFPFPSNTSLESLHPEDTMILLTIVFTVCKQFARSSTTLLSLTSKSSSCHFGFSFNQDLKSVLVPNCFVRPDFLCMTSIKRVSHAADAMKEIK